MGTNEGHDSVGVECLNSIADAMFTGDVILELAKHLVWTKQFSGYFRRSKGMKRTWVEENKVPGLV